MSEAESITRQQVEEFLYEEAALLDAWRLDDWLALMTDDAVYRVPSNDRRTATRRTRSSSSPTTSTASGRASRA